MQEWTACIITYNPDIKIFEKCVAAAALQIKEIIVWDNNSENIQMIKRVIEDAGKYVIEGSGKPDIRLIACTKNAGIGAALNCIFTKAEKAGKKWVLTLDQDSVIPANMMKEYEKYTRYSNIGILSCMTLDRNAVIAGKQQDECKTGIELVKETITSGALTSIEAWRAAGGFDSRLFIDYVDRDFCMKLKKIGYCMLRVNDVQMSHAIGKIKRIRFPGKDIIIYNHSAFRKYHQIRNMIYLDRKYKERITFKSIFHFWIMIIKIILWETDKRQKIMVCIAGFRDGRKL